MNTKTAGAGAVIALASVLALGYVAADTETHPGVESETVEGLYLLTVTFVYPDGTEEVRSAPAYFGEAGSIDAAINRDGPYRVKGYPDPPEGYVWDHPPDYQYSEDTTVRAIPTA